MRHLTSQRRELFWMRSRVQRTVTGKLGGMRQTIRIMMMFWPCTDGSIASTLLRKRRKDLVPPAVLTRDVALNCFIFILHQLYDVTSSLKIQIPSKHKFILNNKTKIKFHTNPVDLYWGIYYFLNQSTHFWQLMTANNSLRWSVRLSSCFSLEQKCNVSRGTKSRQGGKSGAAERVPTRLAWDCGTQLHPWRPRPTHPPRRSESSAEPWKLKLPLVSCQPSSASGRVSTAPLLFCGAFCIFN